MQFLFQAEALQFRSTRKMLHQPAEYRFFVRQPGAVETVVVQHCRFHILPMGLQPDVQFRAGSIFQREFNGQHRNGEVLQVAPGLFAAHIGQQQIPPSQIHAEQVFKTAGFHGPQLVCIVHL